jgi:hypothetical protein
MIDEEAIAAARRRVQEAAEKLDRQQRRYALLIVPADAGDKTRSEKSEAAKALLAALETELEAARENLRRLEEETHG